MKNREIKLLPCPFCGGKAKSENYVIEGACFCVNKNCRAIIIKKHSRILQNYNNIEDGEFKSIEAWNTRKDNHE